MYRRSIDTSRPPQARRRRRLPKQLSRTPLRREPSSFPQSRSSRRRRFKRPLAPRRRLSPCRRSAVRRPRARRWPQSTGRSGADHGAERGDEGHGHRDRARRHGVDPAGAATAGAGHHHFRRRRQPVTRGGLLPRLRRVTGQRARAGRRRLPERRAHQRSLRRHGAVGRDPEQRHRLLVGRQQQPVVRLERTGRRDQHPHEGRLQLPGRRGRRHGRLVRAPPGRRSGRRIERQCRRLCRGRGHQGRRLPRFLGQRGQALLRRCRSQGQLGGVPFQPDGRQQRFRRHGGRARRAARSRLEQHLHLASDHRSRSLHADDLRLGEGDQHADLLRRRLLPALQEQRGGRQRDGDRRSATATRHRPRYLCLEGDARASDGYAMPDGELDRCRSMLEDPLGSIERLNTDSKSWGGSRRRAGEDAAVRTSEPVHRRRLLRSRPLQLHDVERARHNRSQVRRRRLWDHRTATPTTRLPLATSIPRTPIGASTSRTRST